MAYHRRNAKSRADYHESHTQERGSTYSSILANDYSKSQIRDVAKHSEKLDTSPAVSRPTSQATSTSSYTRNRPRRRSTSRNTDATAENPRFGVLSAINETLPSHTREPKLTLSPTFNTTTNPNSNSISLTQTQSTTNPLQPTQDPQSQSYSQNQPHPSSSTTPNPRPTSTSSTAPTHTPTGAEAASKLADALDEFLGDVERKFKGISDEILARLDEMAERCDRLEGELLKRETNGGKEERAS